MKLKQLLFCLILVMGSVSCGVHQVGSTVKAIKTEGSSVCVEPNTDFTDKVYQTERVTNLFITHAQTNAQSGTKALTEKFDTYLGSCEGVNWQQANYALKIVSYVIRYPSANKGRTEVQLTVQRIKDGKKVPGIVAAGRGISDEFKPWPVSFPDGFVTTEIDAFFEAMTRAIEFLPAR